MTSLIFMGADLAAISILTFVLFRRSDLVVSYLGLTWASWPWLPRCPAPLPGLAWDLASFGVLSIIRLRSTELAQHEVAYYFSAWRSD